jgi:hypothetical protein
MGHSRLSAFIIVALALAAAPSTAQTPRNPSGHWEGSFTAGAGPVAVQLDLTVNSEGAVAGTISTAMVSGLPLTKLAMSGDTLTFDVPGNDGARFAGVLSADGKSIIGEFSTAAGSAPSTLVRTGDAKTQAAIRSAAVAKEMEGRWSGVLNVEGQQKRLTLTIANQADNSALATLVSVDDGGIEVPVVVVQNGKRLEVAIKTTGASFAVTLDSSAGELSGTYTERQFTFPIAFRR